MYTTPMFIRFAKSILGASLWIGLMLALFSGEISRAGQIDSYEKLTILNKATGNSSGSGSTSFSNRVNNILDQTASSNRSIIESQDSKVRAQAFQALPEVTSQITGYSASQTEADWNKKRDVEIREEDAAEEDAQKEGEGLLESKLNRSDRAHMEEREAVFKKADEVREMLDQKKKAEEETLEADATKSLGPAFMAGNPFYFGQLTEEMNPYIENRHIIVSRLAHSGYDYDSAVELVHSLTSFDDLIIHLIQTDNYTYGEAMEIVSGL